MKSIIQDLSLEQQMQLNNILQKQKEIEQELANFIKDNQLTRETIGNNQIFGDLGESFIYEPPSMDFIDESPDMDMLTTDFSKDDSIAFEAVEKNVDQNVIKVLSEYKKFYYNLPKDQQKEIQRQIHKVQNIIEYAEDILIDQPNMLNIISKLSDQEKEELAQEIYNVRIPETRSRSALSLEKKVAREEYFKLPLQLKTVPPTFIDNDGEPFLIEDYFDIGNEKYRAQRADLKTGKKQMRHVIPVAFTSQIANTITQIDDMEVKVSSLAQALEIFGSFEQYGYMMTHQEYTDISPSLNITKTLHSKLEALALQAEKMSTDILIPQKLFTEISREGNITIDSEIQNQRLQRYKEIAKEYTIGNIYKILQNNDINSYVLENILRGALTTAFSQHIDVSFPTEGHTMEYEIKIEEGNRSEIIDVKELKEMIKEKNKKELSKIRIVKSEGANVRSAISIIDKLTPELRILTDSSKQLSQDIHDLEINAEQLAREIDGLKKGKALTEKRRILNKNNESLAQKQYSMQDNDQQVTRLVEQITYQMYKVFDYKRLEKEVIIPVESKNHNTIIFNDKNYQIIDGKTYREEERKLARTRYSDSIKFREEESQSNKEEQIEQLTDLVDKYIDVVMLAFPDMHPADEIEKKIVESFIDRVEKDYDIAGKISETIKVRRRETTYDVMHDESMMSMEDVEDKHNESIETSIEEQHMEEQKLQNMSLDIGSKRILKTIKNKMTKTVEQSNTDQSMIDTVNTSSLKKKSTRSLN